MKNLLPLGSVVRLNKGELKIMIISRLPLYNNEGTIGYFDYAACVYPTGQADQQVHFFNEEDIAEVFFEGYRDELEEKFCEKYQEMVVRYLIRDYILYMMNSGNAEEEVA